MLEDFRLKVFVTVVRERSFTKAAAALDITQPAVSHNIAELEKELNTKLFTRLRSEVQLTPEGEVFLRYAHRILSAEAEAVTLFTRLPSSVIRISSSEEVYTYLIYPALQSFSQVHPEITFERVMFGDADLKISLRPSEGSSFDIDESVVAKIRIGISAAPTKMGDFAATQEKMSYFDLLYQPSQAFACTKTCRLLKDYFASLL